MRKCNVALIGVNGFGAAHLTVCERLSREGMIDLRAVCETNRENMTDRISALKGAGVNCYENYMELVENERELDFAVVSTPIHLHRDMAADLMENGLNVLVEKPPAVTIQAVDSMIAVSESTGKLCAVDFMMTADRSFNRLLEKVSSGQLGEIKSIKGMGLWKRLDDYYSRTPWAGRLVYDNKYVLDGTVNNPLAHLLNNMLFLAASAENFQLAEVTAELYHAHRIEAEDTSCIRIKSASGLELLYYATLCGADEVCPFIRVEGTEGFARWNYNNELVFNVKGQTKCETYGEDGLYERITAIYRNLCRTIRGEESRLVCGISDTRDFVLASNGAFESSGRIHGIQAPYISRYEEEGSFATEIKDIKGILENSFESAGLYSEAGVPWAVGGKTVPMEGYKKFKMFM